MKINELITSILSGDLDDDLDAIAESLVDRRKLVARSSFHVIKVGQQATLQNLSPKYLVGAPVTVVEKRQSRLVVRLPEDWLRAHPRASRYCDTFIVKPEMLSIETAA